MSVRSKSLVLSTIDGLCGGWLVLEIGYGASAVFPSKVQAVLLGGLVAIVVVTMFNMVVDKELGKTVQVTRNGRDYTKATLLWLNSMMFAVVIVVSAGFDLYAPQALWPSFATIPVLGLVFFRLSGARRSLLKKN